MPHSGEYFAESEPYFGPCPDASRAQRRKRARCLCRAQTVSQSPCGPITETGSHGTRDGFDRPQFGRTRPSNFHCAAQLARRPMSRVAPTPCGRRPPTAASTSAGSKNASETVMYTERVLTVISGVFYIGLGGRLRREQADRTFAGQRIDLAGWPASFPLGEVRRIRHAS